MPLHDVVVDAIRKKASRPGDRGNQGDGLEFEEAVEPTREAESGHVRFRQAQVRRAFEQIRAKCSSEREWMAFRLRYPELDWQGEKAPSMSQVAARPDLSEIAAQVEAAFPGKKKLTAPEVSRILNKIRTVLEKEVLKAANGERDAVTRTLLQEFLKSLTTFTAAST